MRRQFGEIIRQYPEFQKSADAAKESADAAKEAADTARNQFELTKKQVVAVVTFTGVERDDPRNSTEIDVRFTNTGHVISEPSNVTLEVLYTNLDGTQSMTKSERYSFVIPQLKPPSGQIPDVWSWKHKLKVPLVLNFRDDATVRVTGTIVGSDGFGHKVPTPFCVSYIPYAHIEAEHEGVQMIGDYFADCREFRDSITKIRNYALVE